jgi:hypothetical protein
MNCTKCGMGWGRRPRYLCLWDGEYLSGAADPRHNIEMRLHLGLRRLLRFAGAFMLTIASAATAGAQAIDPAILAQLAPTGKLRVGVAG